MLQTDWSSAQAESNKDFHRAMARAQASKNIPSHFSQPLTLESHVFSQIFLGNIERWLRLSVRLRPCINFSITWQWCQLPLGHNPQENTAGIVSRTSRFLCTSQHWNNQLSEIPISFLTGFQTCNMCNRLTTVGNIIPSFSRNAFILWNFVSILLRLKLSYGNLGCFIK